MNSGCVFTQFGTTQKGETKKKTREKEKNTQTAERIMTKHNDAISVNALQLITYPSAGITSDATLSPESSDVILIWEVICIVQMFFQKCDNNHVQSYLIFRDLSVITSVNTVYKLFGPVPSLSGTWSIFDQVMLAVRRARRVGAHRGEMLCG